MVASKLCIQLLPFPCLLPVLSPYETLVSLYPPPSHSLSTALELQPKLDKWPPWFYELFRTHHSPSCLRPTLYMLDLCWNTAPLSLIQLPNAILFVLKTFKNGIPELYLNVAILIIEEVDMHFVYATAKYPVWNPVVGLLTCYS